MYIIPFHFVCDFLFAYKLIDRTGMLRLHYAWESAERMRGERKVGLLKGVFL